MTAPIDDPLLIRTADAALLAQALADARAHTLRLFAAMRAALGDKLEVRHADELNPPRWELGHVGWFEEFWIARNSERLRGTAARLEAPRAAPLLPAARLEPRRSRQALAARPARCAAHPRLPGTRARAHAGLAAHQRGP
jgi:gamma-glutamyl hercynylcysteine S-oxide synthase